MAIQTNSFSIAHYILLICMVVACGWIVAYAIFHDTGASVPEILQTPTRQSVSSAPDDQCHQNITNAVAQMWTYNPEAVPVKYRDIAMAYYTGPMNATVKGECNGVKYVCKPNMQRMNCDPCAASSARDYAMGLHTRDMIEKHCGK